jgi:hypothetical protein
MVEQMINPLGVQARPTALDAMDFVSLLKQELC